MGFLVENAGMLTTIQDAGRFGYESFGISPSGPMDERAFNVANILVGNELGESALEATILGPTIVFDEANVIAITGADMRPMLNGQSVELYQAFAVKAGDRLQLQAAVRDCRSYIAFAGGLDVPKVMGSKATALQNKIGGFNGRKLSRGDRVAFCSARPQLSSLRVANAPASANKINGAKILRVILGPQDDAFTPEGLNNFLSQPYTIGNEFNRMGCRLEGAKISHKTDGNIISDGMVTGAIQVPTTGQPIIMLAERQTVGGYTKIATVISVDLPVIGQCKPGDVIRFQAIDVAEAQRLWREYHQELQALISKLDNSRTWKVVVNGQAFSVGITEL